MHYELTISEDAREQLRRLPQEDRRRIGYRLQLLQDDLAGPVKKLEGHKSHYRLRVGDFRALFRLKGDTIEVYAVKQRQGAYD